MGDERSQDDINMEETTGLVKEFREPHSDQSVTQAEFANNYSSQFETPHVSYPGPLGAILLGNINLDGRSPDALDTSASDSTDDEMVDDDSLEQKFSLTSGSAGHLNSWVDGLDDTMSTAGSQFSEMESFEDSFMITEDVNIMKHDSLLPSKQIDIIGTHNYFKTLTGDDAWGYNHCSMAGCFPLFLQDSEDALREEQAYSSSILGDLSNDSNERKGTFWSCFVPDCFFGYLDEQVLPLQVMTYLNPEKYGVDTLECNETAPTKVNPSARVRFSMNETRKPVPWSKHGFKEEGLRMRKPARGILRNPCSSQNGCAQQSDQVNSPAVATVISQEATETGRSTEAEEMAPIESTKDEKDQPAACDEQNPDNQEDQNRQRNKQVKTRIEDFTSEVESVPEHNFDLEEPAVEGNAHLEKCASEYNFHMKEPVSDDETRLEEHQSDDILEKKETDGESSDWKVSSASEPRNQEIGVHLRNEDLVSNSRECVLMEPRRSRGFLFRFKVRKLHWTLFARQKLRSKNGIYLALPRDDDPVANIYYANGGWTTKFPDGTNQEKQQGKAEIPWFPDT